MNILAADISVELIKDEPEWNAEALWHDVHVGCAWCMHEGDRLRISDLKVEDKLPVPWPLMHGLLAILGIERRKASFRGHGIGSRLLDLVLSEAVAEGVHEVWGSVTQSDIDSSPFLLQWYERRGFVMTEPDQECIANAVRKIRKRM